MQFHTLSQNCKKKSENSLNAQLLLLPTINKTGNKNEEKENAQIGRENCEC